MVRQLPTRIPPRTASPRVHQAPPPSNPLALLEKQFEVLKARVRQAQQLAGMGTIAPTLAHEVNNLLTPIIGYATKALETGDPELMNKALNVTVKNARIAVNMADRLLQLSAATSAKRTAVSVREAIDNAYAGLCRDVTRDGITYTVDVPDGLTVWADALQFQQVLFNLFLNAREAMKGAHNGRLSVRAFELAGDQITDADTGTGAGTDTSTDEDRLRSFCTNASTERRSVVIEVRNGGKPIPADLIPHVFDAFASSKSATNGHARCSGLGLALCHDLVEENAGRISVSSNEGQGTTFTILMPAARACSETTTNPSPAAEAPN